MSADGKAIIHRWFEEVWNQGREQTIDELFAPDCVAVGLGESDTTVRGPAEFKIFFRNLRGAFPDIHIKIEDTIAENDKVAVRVNITGTHKGDGLSIPPTGRKIHIAGIVVVQVRGGKLAAGWNSWDQLGLLSQVGAIPRPDADRFLEKR